MGTMALTAMMVGAVVARLVPGAWSRAWRLYICCVVMIVITLACVFSLEQL